MNASKFIIHLNTSERQFGFTDLYHIHLAPSTTTLNYFPFPTNLGWMGGQQRIKGVTSSDMLIKISKAKGDVTLTKQNTCQQYCALSAQLHAVCSAHFVKSNSLLYLKGWRGNRAIAWKGRIQQIGIIKFLWHSLLPAPQWIVASWCMSDWLWWILPLQGQMAFTICSDIIGWLLFSPTLCHCFVFLLYS